MKPIDIIVIVILAILIGFAVVFIIRAKKRGQRCIGCPYSGQCPSQKNSDIDCQKHHDKIN